MWWQCWRWIQRRLSPRHNLLSPQVSNSDKDAEQADAAKDVYPIAGLCAINEELESTQLGGSETSQARTRKPMHQIASISWASTVSGNSSGSDSPWVAARFAAATHSFPQTSLRMGASGLSIAEPVTSELRYPFDTDTPSPPRPTPLQRRVRDVGRSYSNRHDIADKGIDLSFACVVPAVPFENTVPNRHSGGPQLASDLIHRSVHTLQELRVFFSPLPQSSRAPDARAPYDPIYVLTGKSLHSELRELSVVAFHPESGAAMEGSPK
jgi:hypothetical protein